MKVEGRTAVITGASSGMGKYLALQLVESGCNVAMCDIRMEALESTRAEALKRRKHENIRVTVHEADVSSKEAVERFAAEVVDAHDGCVHLLFANAGVSGVGDLIHQGATEAEAEKANANFDHCFNVNYYGVLHCLRAFLPHIVKQDEGYVVITSSVNGFITWPSHAAYTSAKFAVHGLADALLCETYVKAPHVHVACVHPGKINTDILKNSLIEMSSAVEISKSKIKELHDKWMSNGGMSSADAASWILHGVANDHTRILVGYDAYALSFIKRFFSHRVYDIFAQMGKEGIRWGESGEKGMDAVRDSMQNLSLLARLRVSMAAWPYSIFVFPAAILGRRPLLSYSGVMITAYLMRKRFPLITYGLLGATLPPLIASKI